MNADSSDSGIKAADDQCCPHVEEKHEEDEGYQDRALEEIATDGANGGVDQIGAVVERHDVDAVGQDLVIQLVDRGAHLLQHDGRVLVAAHQHDALHRIEIGAAADHALPRRPAVGDAGDVADEHRRAVMAGDRDDGDVVELTEQSLAANHQLLGAAFQDAAAGVVRRLLERVLQILDGQTVGGQLCGRGLHVDLAHQAAVADDVGDALHAQQPRLDHPLLQGAQAHGVGARARERVAVDLTDRCGQRTQLRRDAVGKVGVAQPFEHLLAGEQRIDAVGKCQRDVRQPKE